MRNLLILVLGLLVAGCGFQLRGAQPLPFSSLHVATQETSELGAILKRNIRAMALTRLVDTPQEAQAVFTVIGEAREKNILSLSGTGRVREFQLRYRLAYRVHDSQGREFAPPTEIVLVRDISFSDERVLAKEQEESLLYRDMQNDMAQQVLRRLASIKAVARPE